MDLVDKPVSKDQIEDFWKKYGAYIKLTIDIENKLVVVGPELHADGEKMLLEKGCKQINIWGGGINLRDKIIDTTAVLNLRSSAGNDSMEILHKERRERFVNIAKETFAKLWL